MQMQNRQVHAVIRMSESKPLLLSLLKLLINLCIKMKYYKFSFLNLQNSERGVINFWREGRINL